MPTKRRTHTSLRATPSARLGRYAGIIGYDPAWNGTSIYLHTDTPADGLYISPAPLARITVGGLPVTQAYNNGSGQIVLTPDPSITPAPGQSTEIVLSATPPSISDRTGRIVQPGPRQIAASGEAWAPVISGTEQDTQRTISAPDGSALMMSPHLVNNMNIQSFEVVRQSDGAWQITIVVGSLGDWSIGFEGAYTRTLGACNSFSITGRVET